MIHFKTRTGELDIVRVNSKPSFVPFSSEVVAMKAACGPAHMKSILAIGELGSMNNVYKVRRL